MSYVILYNFGNFSSDTFYEYVYKYCHLNLRSFIQMQIIQTKLAIVFILTFMDQSTVMNDWNLAEEPLFKW